MDDGACPLEVRDLRLRRGRVDVLDAVTAAFPRALVTAVVGPSGAGKTSLLRCLNRLEEPDSGAVLLHGRDVRSLDPIEVRRRIGLIFQRTVLFDGGVRANVAYGMGAVDDNRVVAALVEAGLDASFLERASTALSAGQAQRVGIARALVRDPEVLLLDEPTSALDRDAAARIEDLIRSLAERSLAVVLVTHDLAQARRVADRAVLLARGRVAAAGPVAEIEAAWDEHASP